MSQKLLPLLFTCLVCCGLSSLTAQRQQVEPISPFELVPATERSKDAGLSATVAHRTELTLHPEALRPEDAPEKIRLQLPGGELGDLELDLVRAQVLTDEFRLRSSDTDAEIPYQGAAHYRGTVVGQAHSTVALSLLDGSVMAAIQTEHASFILGQLEGEAKSLNRHVLYREQDLLVHSTFTCETPATPFSKEELALLQELAAGRITQPKSVNCVRVYVELDEALVTNKGGVIPATNFMEGLWNMVATLYQNENVETKLNEVFAWTATNPKPYTHLQDFTNTRTTFNGDLAHLVTISGPTGGVAWLNALCGNTRRHAYSRIQTTYSAVPTYSWSVMVLAHEMGHNLGSRHTHDCVWGPNGDSPIDGCSYNSNSSCPQGPIPAGGGTIMSYCHTLGNVGINFNLGFGAEPGAVIRNSVNNASCLSSCGNACFSTSLTTTNDDCSGSGAGTATVSVTGGTAPFTYAWSNGATTATASGLTAGNYDVTISDAASCNEVIQVSVAADPGLTLITEGWGASGTANGRARVRASGGTPPYSYAWSNGATVADVTGLTGPATYTVTVTDNGGCSATADFLVRDEITQNGGCTGTVVRLLFEMDQNDDEIYFQFNDGLGTPLFGQYPGAYTEPGGLISYTFCIPDGCYEFELFDSGRDGLCGANSNPQGYVRFQDVTNNVDLLNVCAIPDTIVTPFCFGGPNNLSLTTSTTTPICYGGTDGTATVTATGGSGNYNYAWSNGGTTATITNLTGGTYSVTVTDGASSQTASATVTQPNVFTATMSSTNTTQGGMTGTATANPVGGLAPFTYLWNNGGTTQTISGLSAGMYTCTLTDANGCMDSRSVEVSADCADINLTVNITNVTCYGGSDGAIEIVPSGGDGNYAYSWSSNVTGSGPTLNGLSQGIYSVTVTSCTKVAYSNVVVSQPTPISISLSATDATSGSNGAIDATVTGGMSFYTYAWSNGATTEDLSNLAPGTYTLTATDAFGCPATATATVQDNSVGQVPLERGRVLVSGDGWQTVTYSGQYTSPVVVATPVLVDQSDDPVVARVRNVTATSFQVRVQNPGGTTTDDYDIEYLVVEEGVYDQTTYGIQMEAVKVTSATTAARGRWGNSYRESRSYQQAYGNPVVLGQVMTENDVDFSVFWASQANSRTNVPTATSFAAGKHVAEDTDQTRANETIGYIVVEAGSGTINGEEYLAGVGTDIVRGTQNSSLGYLYNTPSNVYLLGGVLSAAALDGGDGGWPVFRASPIGNGGIRLATEEDQIRDNERNHTTEQVAYFLLGTSLGASPEATPAPEENTLATTPSSPETTSTNTTELQVFPNPASDYVNIVLSTPTATTSQLRIMDMSGRLLQERTFPVTSELRERISLGRLQPGIYLLQLVSGEEQLTRRIVIR